MAAVSEATEIGSGLSESPARLNVADAILTVIGQAAAPVGARHICAGVATMGHDLSESTAARRLRDLDSRGLTQQIGAKGRVLTPAGRAAVREVRQTTQGARLAAAVDIQTADDLVNLLRARRAVEPEAILDATRSATPQLIEALRAAIEAHAVGLRHSNGRPRDLALSFHHAASQATSNPLVRAMLGLVLNEDLDHVEATLDVILEHHHHSDRSVAEHQAILAAMADGDGEHASDLMRTHLDRLLSEVENFIQEINNPDLIARMLQRG